MTSRVSLLLFVYAALSNSSLENADAAEYSFMSVVDSSGPFDRFDGLPQTPFGSPSINNAGNVAFKAVLDDGSIGIFVGPDAVNDLVAEEGNDFFRLFAPTIDDGGTVYFAAMVEEEEERYGIFSGPDPVVDVVVDEVTLGDRTILQGPAVSGNGTLAYALDGQIFVRSVTGGVSDIEIREYSEVDVNNQGVALFSDVHENELYLGRGSDREFLVNNASQFFSINDHNMVAFIRFDFVTGGNSILTGPHPEFDVVVDTSGPYSNLRPPISINNHGEIVFGAMLDPFGEVGIFTGPNPETDAIIVPGDSLFGSQLAYGTPSGINDAGQIAFTYVLEDGIQGVAVATPIPEPSCLALLLIAAGFLATNLRRRNVG